MTTATALTGASTPSRQSAWSVLRRTCRPVFRLAGPTQACRLSGESASPRFRLPHPWLFHDPCLVQWCGRLVVSYHIKPRPWLFVWLVHVQSVTRTGAIALVPLLLLSLSQTLVVRFCFVYSDSGDNSGLTYFRLRTYSSGYVYCLLSATVGRQVSLVCRAEQLWQHVE
jgi:hypothetical protein